ncbi:TNF receptor-associated factor 6-like [Halichondria panicea]|uniref:TNF receptor-associated factor 6-like n=1 Tax=Halichondria panicea TaxID=6063 RepID=UPI00312B8457
MAALNPNNQQQADKRIIGFDCEFVKPPPSEYIQSQCPICLQIIREPYLVTCCGKKFCKACIEHIKAIKKPCPTCNGEFSSFSDKALKQSLYSLKVRCSHQKNGCEWMGELRQLDKHLNTDPQPEKQFEGCNLVEIDCTYNCGEQCQRKYMVIHHKNECPKRAFSCEYCHDYKSTYDDVTNNHWPVCGSLPVPCPNQCGSPIQHQNIDSHIADECSLTTINCDFHHIGCAVKLARQDMPEHLRENLLTHISLLATSHAKQQDETTKLIVENRILQLDNDNQKRYFKMSLTALQTKVTRLDKLLTSSTAKQQADIATLVEENKQLRMKIAELAPLQQMLIVNSKSLGAPVLTMTNFQQHKRDDKFWRSPPVYTHHQGYKICLGVHANGDATVKGTHVSVFVCFMRGEFDDSLKWPFRGMISVQLLDQIKGKDNKTYTLPYDDKVPNDCCARATEGERGVALGSVKFIAHTELEPKYLRNDTLFFQIHKVELK